MREMKLYKIFNILNIIMLILITGIGILNSYIMFKYKFLNFRYINYIIVGVMLLFILLLLILNIKKKLQIFSFLLSVFLVSMMLFTYSQFKNAIDLFDKVNLNAENSEYTIGIFVKKDSDINSIVDLKGTNILAPTNIDKENIYKLVSDIKNKENIEIGIENINSYLKAYEELIVGKSKAIVLNGAYDDLIETTHQNFKDNLKKIYEYKIVKKLEVTQKEVKKVEKAESFNVYISGIDTFGAISNVSRSDVNVIMTVNMDTHKIVLTTIPRDSYVKIAGGGNNQYDKLTHSGIYGVDASVKTLENLYGINISYYVRVNFTSFMKLIDLLGGVDVENTQTFTSFHGKYNFPKGTVHLDSDRALGFVRERYSLSDGDRDRGRNHEKVISAIIKKLTSKEALINYSSILDELSSSIQTNMPLETVMSLANKQLEWGTEFDIKSQDLKGIGKKGLSSYAMPGHDLYMMQINEDSLNITKELINSVLNGK